MNNYLFYKALLLEYSLSADALSSIDEYLLILFWNIVNSLVMFLSVLFRDLAERNAPFMFCSAGKNIVH